MKLLGYLFSIAILLSSCVNSNNSDTASGEVEAVEEDFETEEAVDAVEEVEAASEEFETSEEVETVEEVEVPSFGYRQYDDNSYQSNYSNYKPSSYDCEGIVVYEGRWGYFIVETGRGFTVLEVYSGMMYEDQKVKGNLNSYGFKYILNINSDSEVRVYIEDFMLSADRAVGWLGRHNKLKYSDQEIYDREND